MVKLSLGGKKRKSTKKGFRKKKRGSKRTGVFTKKFKSFGMTGKTCDVLGKRQKFTCAYEYPVLVAFPAIGGVPVAPSRYSFLGGTYAAPVVQFNASVVPIAAGPGAPGYSGKLKEMILMYRYFRVRGFKLKYINALPTGSGAINTVMSVPYTLSDIAFTVLPTDLVTQYTGLNSAATIPSDIYELDTCLIVQPVNTVASGLSKYYSIPTTTIAPRDTPATTIGFNNAWNATTNFPSMDWNIFLGWDNAPVMNLIAGQIAGTITIGVLEIEIMLEFALPIKNQAIP